MFSYFRKEKYPRETTPSKIRSFIINETTLINIIETGYTEKFGDYLVLWVEADGGCTGDALQMNKTQIFNEFGINLTKI